MRLTNEIRKDVLSKVMKCTFNKPIAELDESLRIMVKMELRSQGHEKNLKLYKEVVKKGLDTDFFRLTAEARIYVGKAAYQNNMEYNVPYEFIRLFGYSKLPTAYPSAGTVIQISLPEDHSLVMRYEALYTQYKETKKLFEGILQSVTTVKRLGEICPELVEFLPSTSSKNFPVPINTLTKASEVLQNAFKANTAP